MLARGLDLGLAEPEHVAQHLLGVLAEQRRRAGSHDRQAGEAERIARVSLGTDFGVSTVEEVHQQLVAAAPAFAPASAAALAADRDGVLLAIAPTSLADVTTPTVTPRSSYDLRLVVSRTLYDAGWNRYGWTEHADGLGVPAMVRALVCEELVGRRMPQPGP